MKGKPDSNDVQRLDAAVRFHLQQVSNKLVRLERILDERGEQMPPIRKIGTRALLEDINTKLASWLSQLPQIPDELFDPPPQVA